MPTPPDVEAMIPVVTAMVATRFHAVPDNVASRDDLVQVGMESVCKAATRWDESKGASWPAFAYQRAWGAVQDHLREAAFGGRAHFTEYDVTSLDAERGDGFTLADVIPDVQEYPDPFVRAAIAKAVASCSLDVQSAFALSHEEDLALAVIGEMMGVSESRVCQWLAAASAAIAAHPAMEGIL